VDALHDGAAAGAAQGLADAWAASSVPQDGFDMVKMLDLSEEKEADGAALIAGIVELPPRVRHATAEDDGGLGALGTDRCQGSCPVYHAVWPRGAFGDWFEGALGDWVEGGGAHRRPVAGAAVVPAFRVACLGRAVDFRASGEDGGVCSGVLLSRCHEAQGTVQVFMIVPLHEAVGPCAGFLERGEACGRQGRMVLEGAEERFGVRIVVAHPRTGMRWRNAEDVHESEHAASLQRAAIVAVQDERRMHGQDGFGEVGALQDGAGMRGILRVPDLGGDDFPAVEVENDIEAEEVPEDGGGQPCDVPCPHRVGSLGRVGGSLGNAAGSADQPSGASSWSGSRAPD